MTCVVEPSCNCSVNGLLTIGGTLIDFIPFEFPTNESNSTLDRVCPFFENPVITEKKVTNLIKYDVLDGKVRETQLFNLAENPNEFLLEHQEDNVIKFIGNKPSEQQKDLAESPQYSAKLAEMEALLLSEMRRLKDPHRFWDQKEN